MDLEVRDLAALKAIQRGRGRSNQPSPERIKRLADLGLVKIGDVDARLSLRGRITVWCAKHKKQPSEH